MTIFTNRITYFFQKLKSFETDDIIALRFKKFLLSEMDRRFGNIESLPLALACILDPRYKKIHFKNPVSLSKAINHLSKDIKGMNDQIDTELDNDSSNNDGIEDPDCLWGLHDTMVESINTAIAHHEQPVVGVATELRNYLDAPCSPRQSNPFQVWEMLKPKYPNMYVLAKKYLPGTATSVPSERLFSEAKLVCTDFRARLSPSHFSRLLFLASVSQNVWDHTSDS